jgi:hypothetical protein
MTLISGIVLPRGILLVSDTRQVNEITFDEPMDRNKKLTVLTPDIILGGSGHENSWHTAQILRNTLYNISSNLKRENILDTISKIFNVTNNLNLQSKGMPLGEIVLSEYDKSSERFLLHYSSGSNNFSSIETKRNVKDTVLIGSTKSIQKEVGSSIKSFLDNIPDEHLTNEVIYKIISEEIHRMYRHLNDKSISKSVYCIYLTCVDGISATDTYYIDESGKLYNIDIKDSGKAIQF